MNRNEAHMVELLRTLRDRHHCSGVKAEFEAEGTRTEELMRLKELTLEADVTLTLKIGGAEAVRDMYDARIVGVDHLLAPMVESPFQLQKYLQAVDTVFPGDERDGLHFLINVETIGTCELFDEMLSIPEIERLSGVVVGRGDLVESLNLPRNAVDGERSFELTREVLVKAKRAGLTTVVGGGVTAATLDFVRRLPPGLLDRYETRKVCFDCPGALGEEAPAGIELALEFELYWLANKRAYHRAIALEDEKRIAALQLRLGTTVL